MRAWLEKAAHQQPTPLPRSGCRRHHRGTVPAARLEHAPLAVKTSSAIKGQFVPMRTQGERLASTLLLSRLSGTPAAWLARRQGWRHARVQTSGAVADFALNFGFEYAVLHLRAQSGLVGMDSALFPQANHGVATP